MTRGAVPWDAIRRWRPFIVAVLVAGLILFLPGSGNKRNGGVATGAAAGSADGRAAGTAADGSSITSSADGAGGAGGATGGTGPGGAGGAAGGATGAGAGAGAIVTGAGLNSAQALASPDCDAVRKRVKVSFTRAAPCAVPWPAGADNGGATSGGVTKDTIRIVIYNPPNDPNSPPIGGGSPDALLASWKKASAPYERFYRQWGRKVQYTVFDGTGNDEVAQRADAIKIAALNPFAVVQIAANASVLLTELSARHVIALANAGVSQQLAQKLAPYLWGTSVQPAEQIVLNGAHYVAARLLGKPAKWAGAADLQVKKRVFGLVQTSDVDQGLFEREFSALGGSIADRETYAFGASNASKWAEQARTTVARLKSKGVTSVIAVSDFLYMAIITKEATNQQWFPEWVTTGLLGQDIDIMAKTFDQVQWQHAFGAGTLYPPSDLLAPQFHFQKWYWGPDWDGKKETGLGPDESALLFSGIHGAGPRLTPETFRDGIFAIAPAGGAAEGGLLTMVWSYGNHGYYPGVDWNGYDDFVEIWWDAHGQGKDNLLSQPGVGVYRYVNKGKRYFYNQWPAGDPNMFDLANTAPYYTDYPTPQERPPDVPCTGCPSGGK